MRKKIASALLSCVSIFALAACQKGGVSSSSIDYGSNYDPKNAVVDKSKIFGMCDLGWSDYSWTGIAWKDEQQLIENLGAKSVRIWLHSNWLLTSPSEYNQTGLALARSIVEDAASRGFQIIGMNHSNFHPSGYSNSSSTVAKPERDTAEGSVYQKWLVDYQTTWTSIVSQFPEITYWEIDNEDNNDVFFSKLCGGTFSLREKADIYTDMLYYASRGIHEANPAAVTVMGGLVIDTAESFLQMIYDNIYSGDYPSTYPDDYFQVACWHPYMANFSEKLFLSTNNDIYHVITDNEKKDKKVFFTEAGFSEANVSPAKIAEFIPKMYAICRDKLPYVESLHYFRMFDALGSTWGSTSEKTFGLFTDPTSHGADNSNTVLAAPKASAKAYQSAAGGNGSLTIYEDKANG
jgi:hypothetical protein